MLHPDNARILDQLGEYLAFTPCSIQREAVLACAQERNCSLDEAYNALLATHVGAETACVLPQIVHRQDPMIYEADAYFQAVKPSADRRSDIDLVHETIAPLELFIADDFMVDERGFALPPLGWFDRSFAFPAIREEGRVWMTVTPNEINTIQPAVRESRGKVLTYGLGLGYYAFHCLLKEDVTSVTVVEKNPAVIDVFRRLIFPFFPRQKDLHIVEADAFEYAAQIMPHAGYDTVFTDLWRDVADGIPLYRQMKSLEAPGPNYLYWMEKTLRVYMD